MMKRQFIKNSILQKPRRQYKSFHEFAVGKKMQIRPQKYFGSKVRVPLDSQYTLVKFIFSKKGTKNYKIFTVNLTLTK